MALLFNELATNAVKHGALSFDSGRVEIHWTQDGEDVDDRQFRLIWTESGGGGAISEPQRTSFGTLLMERSVRNNLGGTIERRWDPAGLVVTNALPARWRAAEVRGLTVGRGSGRERGWQEVYVRGVRG